MFGEPTICKEVFLDKILVRYITGCLKFVRKFMNDHVNKSSLCLDNQMLSCNSVLM